MADACPPRLQPFMALAVAVHPLPAVDVGGGATAVDCATATLPITRAAAPIKVVSDMFVFMAKLRKVERTPDY
jgi:hypothetical protein